jgi:hypothetical protein
MLDKGYLFLILFILGCPALAFFLGRSPLSRTFETKITGKRVRYQESIMASGNAYVPIKYQYIQSTQR